MQLVTDRSGSDAVVLSSGITAVCGVGVAAKVFGASSFARQPDSAKTMKAWTKRDLKLMFSTLDPAAGGNNVDGHTSARVCAASSA